MVEGSRRRDEGMARVDAAVNPAWRAKADRAIDQLARSGRMFTAEDVTSYAGLPENRNAIGAWFSAAARKALISEVGYKRSGRAERHASRMLVWRGTAAYVCRISGWNSWSRGPTCPN